MRKLVSTIFGFLSIVTGLMIVLPRLHPSLWIPQLVLNEFPWIGTLLSLRALRRPRSALGTGFGLFGLVLSLVPVWQFPRARDDMECMMTEGFGADYEQRIPPAIQKRMSISRLWIRNQLRQDQMPLVTIQRDIPFYETSSRTLNLDLYVPSAAPAVGNRYPAVIAIHGGGWRNGDKGGYFEPHHRYLAAQGYVVFDIQYRLTERDGVKWPTPLADVRAAIRFAKSHAEQYVIDPERIALYGRSAGGHLALSAAYRACDEFADTKVKAVVGVYAPANLRLTGPTHDGRVIALLGGTSYELPDVYADASPYDYAGTNSPPTLLLHGAMDDDVSPIHAELVSNRLKVAGVPCAVLRVPWGRHGFDGLMPGLGAQLTQYYVDRFLAWSLYGGCHDE